MEPDFDPPESYHPSPEYDWDVHGARERLTEFWALPLRSIVSLERNDTIAVLSCGHRKALLTWLIVGEHMRCRECYVVGMLSARQMVDG